MRTDEDLQRIAEWHESPGEHSDKEAYALFGRISVDEWEGVVKKIKGIHARQGLVMLGDLPPDISAN